MKNSILEHYPNSGIHIHELLRYRLSRKKQYLLCVSFFKGCDSRAFSITIDIQRGENITVEKMKEVFEEKLNTSDIIAELKVFYKS